MSVCVCIALKMSLCLCSFGCVCVCVCLCMRVLSVYVHTLACVFMHSSMCLYACVLARVCVMMRLWGRQCFLCPMGFHFSAYRDPLSLPHPCLYLIIASPPSTRGWECGSSPSSLAFLLFFFKNINRCKKRPICRWKGFHSGRLLFEKCINPPFPKHKLKGKLNVSPQGATEPRPIIHLTPTRSHYRMGNDEWINTSQSEPWDYKTLAYRPGSCSLGHAAEKQALLKSR